MGLLIVGFDSGGVVPAAKAVLNPINSKRNNRLPLQSPTCRAKDYIQWGAPKVEALAD